MNKLGLAQAFCAISVGIASSAYAASVGASFVGRNAPATLLPEERAGLVEQGFWYNINDAATTPAFTGTTVPLRDDAGNFTTATVSFKGNDSWESNGPSETPNDRLMRGIIKQAGAGTTGDYSVNNLGAGPYDVILYMGMDGDGVSAEMSVNGVVKPVLQTHQFTGTFIEATPASEGNYVRFNGVTPTNGVIGIGMKYIAGANGAGMAAIQVIGSSFPVNTLAASIVDQPVNSTVALGARGGFFVKASADNLNYQWFRNGTAIPGATSASYATPVTTAADDGAKFKVTVGNNLNSVTSEEVVLNVLTPVLAKGFLTAEFYRDIGGTAVGDLTGNGKYTGGVADETRLVVGFETPNGYGDNYGAKVSGFIIPKVSGNYYFYIRSDDASALYLSTDDKPANLSADPIAFEVGCCDAFKEPGEGDETSAAPVALIKDKRYYVVAIVKEGGGGDYLQVAMKEENDTTAATALTVISGDQIGTLVLPDAVITVASQPTSVTVEELNPATFTVSASATTPRGGVPVRYQWQKNGVDIAGATSAKLEVLSPALADNGAKYTVVMGAPGAPDVTSSEVILTVNPDTTAPSVLAVGGLKKSGGDFEVSVLLNEPVATPASLALANFQLSSGTVTAARYVENSSGVTSRQRAVILSTTGLTAGSSYTLTVSGLKDIKGNTSAAIATPFTVSKMTWADLARPNAYGQDVVVTGTNSFNVVNGGSSFWNSNDDATFVYEEITGNFDKVARLEGQDASSQWARAGITARESLDSQDAAASRYQQVHANPSPVKYDGTASNQGYETNRRLTTGAGTTSSNGDTGANGPQYPNAWLRLRRAGDVISMYRSSDGITWFALGRTDFNPADGSGSPLPAKMFVGPIFGAENGNIGSDGDPNRKAWNARFRDYGDFQSSGVAGSQTYSIGINFTDDNRDGSVGPKDIAGTAVTAQPNWNNAIGLSTTDTGPVALTADEGGVAKTTTATVEWSGSGNTWTSTGRGEENNKLTGPNHLLMTGFLDTSNDSTTQVTIKGLGSKFTTGKYDVVVYTLGGVASGRGGAFRVTDAAGTELKGYVLTLTPENPTELSPVPIAANATPGDGATYGTGSYIVFKGLSSPDIIVEGTTAADANGVDLGVGGTQRAPLNAVQVVSPSGLFDIVVVTPTISIQGLQITFTGKLLSSDSVNGTYTEVSGATSPFTINPANAAQKFYRAGN
jgi:hypothetical protein